MYKRDFINKLIEFLTSMGFEEFDSEGGDYIKYKYINHQAIIRKQNWYYTLELYEIENIKANINLSFNISDKDRLNNCINKIKNTNPYKNILRNVKINKLLING